MRRIIDIRALMDEINASMPLSQAISMYLPLKKDGAGWSCTCPWHNEQIPSFKVSDEKRIWRCWGACKSDKDKSGTDIIKFIQTYFGLSFTEAVEKFIEDTHINLDHHFRSPTPEEQWYEYYSSINAMVADFCRENMVKNTAVHDMFLTGKQIGADVLKQFRIGYTTNVTAIMQHLRSKGVDQSYIHTLDLDRAEMWENRIVYPIMDVYGHIITFRNRALSDNTAKFIGTHSTSPLHPPDLPIYGLQIARRHIRKNDGVLIIVEGHNDVLAMHNADICNVAASMGTSFSEVHLPVLEKLGVKQLIMMFDGDNAGQTANSAFSAQVKYSGDIVLKVAKLPPPFDPDELIRVDGVRAINKAIKDAKFYLDYYFDEVDTPTQDMAGKYLFLHAVKPRVITLDGMHKSLAYTEISKRIDVPRDAVEDYFKGETTIDVLHCIDAEHTVLNGMIRDHEFRLTAIDTLKPEAFYMKRNAVLFTMIRDIESSNGAIDPDTIWLAITSKNLQQLWPQGDYQRVISSPQANYDSYLNEVMDKYLRRCADIAADRIKVDVRDATANMETVLDGVNVTMTKLLVAHKTDIGPEENAHGVDMTMEFIKHQMQEPGNLPGIHLGNHFECLTQALGGLRRKTMIMVGGLPGVGKTAMMEKWALHMAVFQRIPVLWLALEMKREALDIRNISILSAMDGNGPVSTFEMERGYLNEQSYGRVASLAAMYRAAPFYAICSGSVSVQQAIAIARYYKHTQDIGAVFLDYAQLLTSEGRYDEDWKMQKDVSKLLLDGVSRDLDVGLVVASQLNRAAASASRGKNTNDLPGGENVAGSIRFYADCDAFLVPLAKTPAQMEHWPNKGAFMLSCDKNRNGPTGIIHMNFDGGYASWFEIPDQGNITDPNQ